MKHRIADLKIFAKRAAIWIRQYRTLLATIVADPLMTGRVAELRAITKKAVGWILVSEVLMVVQPYPIKWFFDGLQHGWSPIAMNALCVGAFALYHVGTQLHSIQASLRTMIYWKVWAMLWGYCHLRELKLDTSWHISHSTGDKESLIVRNVTRVNELVNELVHNTVSGFLRIILTSLGVLWLRLSFGGLALVTFAAFGLAMLQTERAMGPLRKYRHKFLKSLERQGTQINANWRTIKQMGIEVEICLHHWQNMEKFCEEEAQRFVVFQKHWKLQEHTVNIARWAVYAMCYYTYDPGAPIGSIILATAWMERIFSNFYRLDEFQRRLNEGLEAARELAGILQIVPEIRQPENPQWPTGGIQGNFELTGVSFSFANNKAEEALKELSLNIRAFECLALVDHTGSGKSTAVSLLMHEHNPTHGTITVDGIDLREIDHDRYRREAVSVVSQKISLFDGTIEENIRIARPYATREDVVEAAKQADAHDFISNKKHGYQTKIGEDGIELSGGQRQRIAIARALVRKPRILILDEATSSLDGESQAEVQKAIDRLISNRQATIVVIAHRLSTVRKADRIVVLDEGRIAEIGTHAQLHAQEGIYRRFIERELAGFAEQS